MQDLSSEDKKILQAVIEAHNGKDKNMEKILHTKFVKKKENTKHTHMKK